MITPTLLRDHVRTADFISKATRTTTSAQIEALLEQLPIVSEDIYSYNEENPEDGWQDGKFHWMPVGRDRGNKGRIALANVPVNPIAERTVNGMEAIIEMARQRELLRDPNAQA